MEIQHSKSDANLKFKKRLLIWTATGLVLSLLYGGVTTYLHYLEFVSLASSQHAEQFKNGLKVFFTIQAMIFVTNYMIVSFTLSMTALAVSAIIWYRPYLAFIMVFIMINLAPLIWVTLYGVPSNTLGEVHTSFRTQLLSMPFEILVSIVGGVLAEMAARFRHRKAREN